MNPIRRLWSAVNSLAAAIERAADTVGDVTGTARRSLGLPTIVVEHAPALPDTNGPADGAADSSSAKRRRAG